jgi:hypothetical protein
MRDEAGRDCGAGSLQKHCAARAKRQLSKSTRVVIQPTMIVRAIFGEGPLLAQSCRSSLPRIRHQDCLVIFDERLRNSLLAPDNTLFLRNISLLVGLGNCAKSPLGRSVF